MSAPKLIVSDEQLTAWRIDAMEGDADHLWADRIVSLVDALEAERSAPQSPVSEREQ